MKFFVFLLIVNTLVKSQLVFPPELKVYIDEIHEICSEKIGLTEDQINKYNITDKDPKIMCYMDCLMKTSKWMDADGTIEYDFITDTLYPEIADILTPVINKCREIETGNEDCEKAYNFNMCLAQEDPDDWYLL